MNLLYLLHLLYQIRPKVCQISQAAQIKIFKTEFCEAVQWIFDLIHCSELL